MKYISFFRVLEQFASMTGEIMKRLPVTNNDIAEYIGQTPRNINLSYELPSKKKAHYLCLQIGTILHLRGIEPVDFLNFVDAYDALNSMEVDRLREIEKRYNKMLGIANGE